MKAYIQGIAHNRKDAKTIRRRFGIQINNDRTDCSFLFETDLNQIPAILSQLKELYLIRLTKVFVGGS